MNTASILIKTDPKIKEKAQKTAEAMGISLTSVINRYLKHFITTKTITFSAQEEIPNARTVQELKQSEGEFKAGEALVFETKEAVGSHLKKLMEHARHN